MKKYPKALADAEVLTETIRCLYEQAENCMDQVASYKEAIEQCLKDESISCAEEHWQHSYLVQEEAKASAYTRLAEKLCK